MEISQDLKILQAVVSSMMKNDSLSGISFNTFSVETLNLGTPNNGGNHNDETRLQIDQTMPVRHEVVQNESIDAKLRLPQPKDGELHGIHGDLRPLMESILDKLPKPRFHHLVKLMLQVGVDQVGQSPTLVGEYIGVSRHRAITWLKNYDI